MGFFEQIAKFAGFAAEKGAVSTAVRGVEETLPKFAGKTDEFVFHVTDVSRAEKIRKEGLRAGSWFAKTPEETLRAGVTPISGNIRDLRIFAVPRHLIKEVEADAADMGARLIEKGKYLKTGVAVMPAYEVPIEEAIAKAFPRKVEQIEAKKVVMMKQAEQLAAKSLQSGAGHDNTSLLNRSLSSGSGSRRTSSAL